MITGTSDRNPAQRIGKGFCHLGQAPHRLSRSLAKTRQTDLALPLHLWPRYFSSLSLFPHLKMGGRGQWLPPTAETADAQLAQLNSPRHRVHTVEQSRVTKDSRPWYLSGLLCPGTLQTQKSWPGQGHPTIIKSGPGEGHEDQDQDQAPPTQG
jgi:hypothetical protein